MELDELKVIDVKWVGREDFNSASGVTTTTATMIRSQKECTAILARAILYECYLHHHGHVTRQTTTTTTGAICPFPFPSREPYRQQIDMMNSMLRSMCYVTVGPAGHVSPVCGKRLDNHDGTVTRLMRGNAEGLGLYESPTGTGKSWCVQAVMVHLASLLAVVAGRIATTVGHADSMIQACCTDSDGKWPLSPIIISTMFSAHQGHDQEGAAAAWMQQQGRYAHSAWSGRMRVALKTLYMESALNPTTEHVTLASDDGANQDGAHDDELRHRLPLRFVFASRTHTQLDQFCASFEKFMTKLRELPSTCLGIWGAFDQLRTPSLIVMAGRKTSCIHTLDRVRVRLRWPHERCVASCGRLHCRLVWDAHHHCHLVLARACIASLFSLGHVSGFFVFFFFFFFFCRIVRLLTSVVEHFGVMTQVQKRKMV